MRYVIILMCQALGVLSSLVERLDGAAAASLAAVEGLAAALLDQVLAAGETLMRCGAVKTSGGGTSGSGGAASTHGPRTGGGGGGGGGSGGGSMGMSSGELPDVGTLQVGTLTPRSASTRRQGRFQYVKTRKGSSGTPHARAGRMATYVHGLELRVRHVIGRERSLPLYW